MEVDWPFLVLILLAGLRVCLATRRDAVQAPMPDSFPYPCQDKTLWRSAKPPLSAHALRPGDIDVVAAIGDSLTAANGAMADNMYDTLFRENRGVSWSAGGQGNWRKFLTVPNLLKEMNPQLVGYSTGDGRFSSRSSQFNMAYVGAMDQDLMMQARKLLTRMRADRRVSFKKHWKMITVMIGTNDVCTDTCYAVMQGPETHRRLLNDLLEFLRDHFPRTFVNLVSMPYVPEYAGLLDPPFSTCEAMQLIDCLCLFGGQDPEGKLKSVTEITRAFQQVEKEVADKWKDCPKEDFAVVYQPTNLNSSFPMKQPGTSEEKTTTVTKDNHDYSFVSIDCIHYSQKLMASVANTFWNNLFEVPGNKTSEWIVPAYSTFMCPTQQQPYLSTFLNSDVNAINKI